MNSSCQDMDAVDSLWKWDALICAISVTNICPAVTLLLQLTPVLTGTETCEWETTFIWKLIIRTSFHVGFILFSSKILIFFFVNLFY